MCKKKGSNMEENNQENIQNTEQNKHICFENHCWKKCLAMVLAAFLGGLLAFYFVMDQMAERLERQHFNPKPFEKQMFKDFDRMYKQDMRAFDDAFNLDKRMKKLKHPPMIELPDLFMNSVKIKTDFDDDVLKITVGLKPFQDDENKINYNISGRKLTIFGSSQVKDKDFENDISFSQDFILPKNADTANISKVKDKHHLVISVPLK